VTFKSDIMKFKEYASYFQFMENDLTDPIKMLGYTKAKSSSCITTKAQRHTEDADRHIHGNSSRNRRVVSFVLNHFYQQSPVPLWYEAKYTLSSLMNTLAHLQQDS
jgi:hypothetical protein